jgi:uncharacterized coiled-coil protein SlyX
MTSDNQESRISRLEMLFSEQEYTVQALSDIIARHDRTIEQLRKTVEVQRKQLRDLKDQLPADDQAGNVVEKPPHY